MLEFWVIGAEIIFLLLILIAIFILLVMRRDLEQQKKDFNNEITELEDHRDFLNNAGARLLELKSALELEREKSDKLLRNILPERVIKDLQEKGTSQPERFEYVAVFFADIVNFTGIVPEMEPEELVCELNDIFGTFDRIFARHNCERIKTVGDAYMAAAGMRKTDGDPCCNILYAALEARNALLERNQRPASRQWQMRFGVNTGPVIGGIVGQEKYIYDIFGDTVNMASRIEHSSEAMKINVPEKIVLAMENKFDFAHRGRFEVKGRGEIEMYFLNGTKKL